MIRTRPYDFLRPKLEWCLSDEVRKTEIIRLEPVSVLFHSGYLTIDKVSGAVVANPVTGEEDIVDSYCFRLPNFEASSSLFKDCLQAVFGDSSSDGLSAKGKAFEKALLARDAKTVGAIGRLELHVELPDRVRVAIEMKYRSNEAELTPKEENRALAALMVSSLDEDARHRILAGLAKKMMKPIETLKISSAT
jgi:hypothetical protein